MRTNYIITVSWDRDASNSLEFGYRSGWTANRVLSEMMRRYRYAVLINITSENPKFSLLWVA